MSEFKKYLKKVGVTPGELYVLFTILAIILGVPFLVMCFWKNLSFGNTGIVGDTFGGLTTPLLSFFGSVLVYFALKSQIKANKIITDQFKEQSQDQLFFRLFDNVKELIDNMVIQDYRNNYHKKIDAIEYLSKHFKDYLSNTELVKVGVEIIKNKFSLLDKNDIEKITEVLNPEPFYPYPAEDDNHRKQNDEIKNKLISLAPNDKINFIHEQYIKKRKKKNSISIEINIDEKYNFVFDSEIIEVLKAIGKKYFYEVEYEDRKKVYKLGFNSLSSHITFINQYLNTYKYIFQSINDSVNKNSYEDYLFYNMTEFEKTFLLFVAVSTNDEKFSKNIKNFLNKHPFTINRSSFLNDPDEMIAQKEISNLLSLD